MRTTDLSTTLTKDPAANIPSSVKAMLGTYVATSGPNEGFNKLFANMGRKMQGEFTFSLSRDGKSVSVEGYYKEKADKPPFNAWNTSYSFHGSVPLEKLAVDNVEFRVDGRFSYIMKYRNTGQVESGSARSATLSKVYWGWSLKGPLQGTKVNVVANFKRVQ